MPRRPVEDIAEADHARLSERDSLRVLELIENPPAPNARLRAAARTLPRLTKSRSTRSMATIEATLKSAGKL